MPEADSDCLSAKIEVLALFKGGKAYPQSFTWKNKTYAIQRVTYGWQEGLGQALISYFSVESGSDLYQISFNNVSMEWRIDKLIA